MTIKAAKLTSTSYDYPKEFYIPFENDPYKEGRLIVNLHEENYSVEIDILQKGSRKIFIHVALLSNLENEQEAIEAGIFKLKQFFSQHESRT